MLGVLPEQANIQISTEPLRLVWCNIFSTGKMLKTRLLKKNRNRKISRLLNRKNDKKKLLKKAEEKLWNILEVDCSYLLHPIFTYPQNEPRDDRANKLVPISHSPRWLGKFNFYLYREFFLKLPSQEKTTQCSRASQIKFPMKFRSLLVFLGHPVL